MGFIRMCDKSFRLAEITSAESVGSEEIHTLSQSVRRWEMRMVNQRGWSKGGQSGVLRAKKRKDF